MPELPEMENYKSLLYKQLVGQTIMNIKINREKSINVDPSIFIEELKDQKLLGVERRAKYLIFKLASGKQLLLHLMLGGWMYIGKDEDSPDRTKQVILSFDHERYLYFIGLRLGYLHLMDDDQLNDEFDELGPEPLEKEFTYETFLEMVENKRSMLKTMLVDQQFISGIGNCYSDEICYVAQLRPDKTANDLKEHEKRNLYDSIQLVLTRAINYGGYMDHSLYQGDNLTGGYQEHTYVYDREGKPCQRCGRNIIKEEISSRKSFYCQHCQF